MDLCLTDNFLMESKKKSFIFLHSLKKAQSPPLCNMHHFDFITFDMVDSQVRTPKESFSFFPLRLSFLFTFLRVELVKSDISRQLSRPLICFFHGKTQIG